MAEQSQSPGIDPEVFRKTLDRLTQYVDLLGDIDRDRDYPIDYHQITTDNTQRTSIRVTEEQKQWGDGHKIRQFAGSRELFYAYCVEFARHNPQEFTEFVIDYIEHEHELIFGDKN